MCSNSRLIGGDFNVFRNRDETTLVTQANLSIHRFNNFIQKYSLLDPPLSNNKFTWSNLIINPTYFRLDRFLYSKD